MLSVKDYYIIRISGPPSIGDPIVHEKYGIGRYAGLQQLIIDQEFNDFIVVEYPVRPFRLYIPVLSVDLLHQINFQNNEKPNIPTDINDNPRKPSKTEKVITAKNRIGQDKFREDLIKYWEGKCAVTGFGVRELLKASHIKPWKDSKDSNKFERRDKFNGLLLAPGLDSAFDKGYITFSDIDGSMLISDKLSKNNKELLGIVTEYPKLSKLDDKHKVYLRYHLSYVYEKWK